MKTASLKEIKTALETVPNDVLLELCLKLIKYKKENKELLSYLLFEETDENNYVAGVKFILDELFETVNKTQPYSAKKTLRKIIRIASKYIKYSTCKTTEPDILIYVCEKMKDLHFNSTKNTAIYNIYNAQIKKIKKAVDTMHEDEQYDYLKLIEEL